MQYLVIMHSSPIIFSPDNAASFFANDDGGRAALQVVIHSVERQVGLPFLLLNLMNVQQYCFLHNWK